MSVQDGKGGNRRYPRWGAEELALLDQAYGVLPIAELAERLGRPSHGIVIQARKRGLMRGLIELHTLGRMLGVNDYTIRRWIKAGVLRAHRSHATASDRHRVRIRPGDLRDFLRDYRFLYDAPLIVDPALRRYVGALPPQRERWHTPKEAVAVLRSRGIAAEHFTVRRWLRKGDLVGVLIGGRYWLAESVLRAFVPPAVPSLKGVPRAAFGTLNTDRNKRRGQNKARTGGEAYRRRHASGPTEIGDRTPFTA